MENVRMNPWKFIRYAVIFIIYCILYIACLTVAMIVVAVNKVRVEKL